MLRRASGAGCSSADRISPHDWASGRRRIASAYTRVKTPGRRNLPFLRSCSGLPAAVRVCRSAVESIIGGLSTVVSLEHSEPGIAFDATAIRSNRRSPACREGTVALSLDNATLGQDGADALRPAKSWSFFCAATGAMGKWAVFGRFSPRRPERLAVPGKSCDGRRPRCQRSEVPADRDAGG